MVEYGLKIVPSEGGTHVQLNCAHQRGLLYTVPAEKSWVCSQAHMPAHVLAGFMKELTDMDNPSVKALMQRWGLYFRQLPLEEDTPQA